MITKKDLDDAEARGATMLYAVFPNPQGTLEIAKQSLRTVKDGLEESLKQSAKLPEWAERRFLTYEEAARYLENKEWGI